jgi:thiol-disulfide isomerase/thioredoxin
MAWQGETAWGNQAGGEVTAYIAPWCGFSQKLMSQLDENKADLNAKGITVNLIDCTDDAQKPICEAANIKGYPHMKNGCGQENPGWVDHNRFCDFAQCKQ